MSVPPAPNKRLQWARLRLCLPGGSGVVHHRAVPRPWRSSSVPLKRGVGWTRVEEEEAQQWPSHT